MNDESPTRSVTSLDAETPRVIGPTAAFAVVAGSMLGVGIFLFPGKVAFEVDTVLAFFFLWGLGGLFALAGSVACGELGAMMPRAGGDYVFQREAFGPSVAFASGWVLFAAIFSGSIASMSVAVFQYQVAGLAEVSLTIPLGASVLLDATSEACAAATAGLASLDPGLLSPDALAACAASCSFVDPCVEGASCHGGRCYEGGLPFSGAQMLAIGLILVLTLLNDAGTKVSAAAQVVLTLAPIAALTALSVYVLTVAPAPVAEPTLVKQGATVLTLGGLAAGFLYVNFAFSGWINIIYVASEVKDPGKNVPRSMISATFGVTALYMLMCVAFLSVLGFAGLSALGWTDAGTGMAEALGSPILRTMVLIVIAVAIVTSLNATVLASARVAYAMGKDGAFWRGAAVLSGERKVPRRALWAQAALSSAFVLSGTFDDIVKMTSIAMFVTGTLTVLSMFVLRRTRPEAPRPYRANLYPYLPALYVLLSVVAIAASVWQAAQEDDETGLYPMIGVGVLAVAFIGHLIYRRKFAHAAGVGVALLGAGLLVRHLSSWNLA